MMMLEGNNMIPENVSHELYWPLHARNSLGLASDDVGGHASIDVWVSQSSSRNRLQGLQLLCELSPVWMGSRILR